MSAFSVDTGQQTTTPLIDGVVHNRLVQQTMTHLLRFDNIKHTERFSVKISMFFYDTTYLLSNYVHIYNNTSTPFKGT